MLVDVEVWLQSIVDMTNPIEQRRVATSGQELTGDWRTLSPLNDAPTQQLGAALFATKGVEGFLAISSTMPLCKILVVFPQKLRQGSELVFSDAITGKAHRIGSQIG